MIGKGIGRNKPCGMKGMRWDGGGVGLDLDRAGPVFRLLTWAWGQWGMARPSVLRLGLPSYAR